MSAEGFREAAIAPLRAPIGVAVAAALDRVSRLSSRRAGVVVVYHRVADPQEDPDSYLVASMGTALFAAQVRHLQRRYRLVPPAEILEAVAERRRGEPFPAAVTFDDDLPTHLTDAIPILRRLGASAAFFLTGASLAGPSSFWWERLDVALNRGAVTRQELCERLSLPFDPARPIHIYDLTAAVEELPPDQVERLSEWLLEHAGPDPRDPGMPAGEVRAVAEAGFEVGFHTRRHHVLPGLDDAGLKQAMEEGLDELRRAAGVEISSIAYPHGKADARVAAAARAAGFERGFTVEHEPVDDGCDPLLIPRLYPLYESLGHFALRLARVIRSGRAG